jgi:hypothetical protein
MVVPLARDQSASGAARRAVRARRNAESMI